MGRLVRKIITIVALVVGVGCLCYPVVSDCVMSAAQEKVAKENVVAAEALDDDSRARLLEEARDYNAALAAGMTYVSDPFDPNAPVANDDDYYSAMAIEGQDAMAVLRIPSIDVYVPVYHGTSDEVLQRGAGHLRGSSLPVGGETTHCVVAGHTGLPSVKIFDRLEEVAVGDYVYLEALGQTLCYEVTQAEVVEPENTDSLGIVEGEDLLTLVTCTPYGINSHRLLVHASRCEPPAEPEGAPAAERQEEPPASLVAPVAASVLLAALALFLEVRRRRKRVARRPAHAREDWR